MAIKANKKTGAFVLSLCMSAFSLGCEEESHTPARPVAPPSSPIIALTPIELNNTIADLLGMPRDSEGWPSRPTITGTLDVDTEYEDGLSAQLTDAEKATRGWPWDYPREVGLFGFEGMAEGQVPSPLVIEDLQRAASNFALYSLVSPTFFACDNWADLDSAAQKSCGWGSILRFSQRAWRSPLSEAEQDRLQAFWEINWNDGTPEEAVVLTVTGILQTPDFLFRIEEGRVADEQEDALPLSDWEMASRLSYFLWDSMPDPELFGAASKGELRTQAQVEAQARRMLNDDKAREAVIHFHHQWLGTLDIETIATSRKAYGPTFGISAIPAIDTTDDRVWPSILISVRTSLFLETGLFVERTIFDGRGTFSELLTDNHGYMSASTEPLYGEGAIPLAGDTVSYSSSNASSSFGEDYNLTLYPAEFPADERAGVITLPSVLMRYAHPVHPAPILRGKFVIERLTCQHLGQPPPGAEGEAPPDNLEVTSTNRERTEQVTSPPQCAACHTTMNPPGFALENYDAMGGYRTQDNGLPVDASGSLMLSGGEELHFANGVDLAHELAGSAQVQDCYSLLWLRYALGLEIRANEDGVAALQKSFRDNDNIKELLVTIASSDLFRYRNAGGAP